MERLEIESLEVTFSGMSRLFLCFFGAWVGLFAATPGIAQTQPPAPLDLARSLNKAFGDVYEKVSPGVVVIEVEQQAAVAGGQGLQLFFQDQNGWEPMPRSFAMPSNQGSGFLITPDGYVLTNNHVLQDGTPGGITVSLKDGREFPAQVVGIDAASDLAVLKIDGNELPVVEFGDSDVARVGEFAFALGAPFDLRYSFTFGVIGAKGRTDLTNSRNYEEYIQTDAAINPGNSGGPLVDIEGRVIGVNTLINGVNRGLGFAIPINIARDVAAQLIANGRVVRPWLGIEIASLSDSPILARRFPGLKKGVFVSGIQSGTPASRSSLMPDDVIVRIDGKEVGTSRELQKAILGKKVGDEVDLDVYRNNRIVKMRLQTGERTDDVIRAVNSGGLRQHLSSTPHPFAGLEVETLTPNKASAMRLADQKSGAIVTAVEAGSPADAARVQVGDVITAVGTKEISNADELLSAIEQLEPGAAAELKILRGDKKTFAILKP